MKKQLKYVGLSLVFLSSVGMGMVGEATTTGDGSAYVEFDKGSLTLVPIDYWNPSGPEPEGNPIVPTFDFGKLKIGDTNPTPVRLVGDNSQSEVLKATGVANYLGDGSGWMITVSAEDFDTANYPKLPGSVFDFNHLKASNVIGNQVIKNISSDKKVTTGKEASPIFISEKGDVAAGKFQFDYSTTTLALSNHGAQSAKPAAYQSTLTWHLSAQSNDGKGQQGALPLK